MTRLLEDAYDRIAQLTDTEQDEIAALILDELGSEDRWNRSFAQSADRLSSLAREAREEHRAGKTVPLDPETL